jgi:nitrile hydratase
VSGIHDLGGMRGFGPIEPEADEPVFHASWEGRLFGMLPVVGYGIFQPNNPRHHLERLEPAFYLQASYWERWLEASTRALIARGLITPDELAERIAHYAADPAAPVPTSEDPAKVDAALAWAWTPDQVHQEADMTPRFRPGDRVRARTTNPPGHIRLPNYVRGKAGVIHRFHGVHIVSDHAPDQNLPAARRPREPAYLVKFDALEVWGDSAEPMESLYLDLSERHLEPA